MKLTKIVATIGPVSDSEEQIAALIKAGVNIFRFNFKHNTIEWHAERIARVNKIADSLDVPIGTLLDLQGPEIRINMSADQMAIKKGDMLIFGEEALEKKEPGFSISHPDIISHLIEGQKLLADDGTFSFYVRKKGNKTYLEVGTTGILKHRKSLNIPGADFPFPVLVERDFEGLQLTVRHEIDYVALSFVRSAEDLRVVRREMKKYEIPAKMVAKIETKRALDHLEEIVKETDAIMVARGDLGVELPVEQVPYYQKVIIETCLSHNVPVITATQMMQSMIENPIPTRAEVSDVANACFDLTDAVMLSGETAAGKYPLETVTAMANTVIFNEPKLEKDTRVTHQFNLTDHEAVMADTAYNLYLQNKPEVKAFIIFTETGRTPKLVSRFHPRVPIFAFTPLKTVRDSMTILFGVYPMKYAEKKGEQVGKNDIQNVINLLKEQKLLQSGDQVIVLHGDIWSAEGGTNTLRLIAC